MSAPFFKTISDINPDDPSTYEGCHFLTFDIDWAHDDVIAATLDLLEGAGVKSTWFVTHETPILDRMRENGLYELAIHPNFNNILNGDHSNGKTAEDIVDRVLEIVPEAKTVRSHSLTQSSRLVDLFAKKGLTHDCNDFIPYESGVSIRSWKHWSGIIKCPHFWEDDIESFKEKPAYDHLEKISGSLKIFDFHPIHIFLNTDKPSRYEAARPYFHDVEKLTRCINQDGYGSRTALQSLIKDRKL
jgi:hypothetical protein